MARIPFKGSGRPIPFQMLRPLASTIAAQEGQVFVQTAAGFAVLASATVPNCISLGPAERDEDAGTSDGAAKVLSWNTFVSQYAASTIANDALLDSDFGVVAWTAGPGTPGKLSNSSGNRSIWGLAFGLDFEANKTPLTWVGPVAWCVARGVHLADNESGGTIAYAVDASASTDLGTATDPLLIPTKKTHGRITSIEIIPSADLAATGGTNYRIVTIYKINTLTNVVGPVVGTLDLRTQALAKRTPTQFTLSATSTDLDMLETDVLGYASIHTASGAAIPQSIIRVNKKVQ